MYRYITPILRKENQTEKNMESEMDTGIGGSTKFDRHSSMYKALR